MDSNDKVQKDFIRDIVDGDLKTNKYKGRVHTRFPPEPNGYLHIGHAKSICLNFGIAEEYNGKCNLRFDDTNPSKEEEEYVKSIIKDVKWLGFDWEDRLFFGSDYFDQMHEYAIQLIKKGKAYVDDLSAGDISNLRGTLIKSGVESFYRNRSIEENLELPNDIKVVFYRITQEAFNNINKYSEATQVKVFLTSDDRKRILKIEDDGRGFDPTKVRRDSMGLSMMKERAEGISAEFTIQTIPGIGTSISVLWEMNINGEI